MEPAVKIAIGSLVVSFLSWIGVVVNSVITAKTYKKNRRLEFLQRRDLLSRQISSLNDKNTEFHLISARYELVAVRNAGLSLQGEAGERNTALIASIKVQNDGVEKGMAVWEDLIERLHFIYSKLHLETDGPEVERWIGIVQVASDNLKRAIVGYSSVLHILETTTDLLKTTLTETEERIRRINANFEVAVATLTNKPRPEA